MRMCKYKFNLYNNDFSKNRRTAQEDKKYRVSLSENIGWLIILQRTPSEILFWKVSH